MAIPKTFTAGERLFADDLNDDFVYLEDEVEKRPFIVNTDDNSGKTIYVGSVDPSIDYTLVPGDVWVEVSA